MKILKAFFYCFFILVFILLIYRHDENSTSVHWLVGFFSLFLLYVFGSAIIDVIEKKKGKGQIIGSIFVAFMCMGFPFYHEILNYKRNVCNAKFGREFNVRRRSLGVPEIPVNWHVKYNWTGSVTWQAKDSVKGHGSKRIYVDSVCDVESEEDEYDLKPLHHKARDMSVYTKYARGKAKDSIFFKYYNGDTTRIVSSQQADSIFASEKIKTDY